MDGMTVKSIYLTELGQGSVHMDTATLNERNSRLTRGLAVVESIAEREKSVLSSSRWTTLEKRNRLAEAARGLDGEVAKLQAEHDRENTRLQTVTTKLNTVEAETVDVGARAVLATEARQVLRNTDTASRLGMALAWARKPNADALAALLGSPDDLVSDEHLKQIVDLFNKTHRPDLLRNQRQLGLATEHIKSLVETLHQWQSRLMSGQDLPVKDSMGVSVR